MAVQSDWTKEETIILIEYYKSEEDLWNILNPNYTKKGFRTRALERLAENFDDRFTVDAINKKIIHLRSYYGRELAKIRKSQKSGASLDDLYKSKWPFFDQLDHFLRAQITPRGPRSNMDSQYIEDEQESDEDIKTEEISRSRTPTPPEATKKRKLSGQDDILSEVVEVLTQLKSRPVPTVSATINNLDDEDAIFAKYLTIEMKKVQNQAIKNNLKLSLQKQIFDAQREEEILKNRSSRTSQLPHTVNSSQLKKEQEPKMNGTDSF